MESTDITAVQPFGKYRIIGAISRGGMARLSLAIMVGVDGFTRVVALKQVLPHLTKLKEFTRMFLNEARLAARLDHPNIVRIYELGHFEDQYFFSMEYLPGENIGTIVGQCKDLRRAIPVPIAAAIAAQLADALQCAHELKDDDGTSLGIVHRDVSPSNIIVTYHGTVKLVDFGIAKATAVATENETRTGVFKGKYAYASPEQVLGQPVDARSDIFALGVVLWETLTRRRLFKREHEAATIRAVERAEVEPVRDFRPDLPPSVDQIVMKALARRAEDRFQSAAELSEALHIALKEVGAPSARDIRGWMAELFGERRAELKKAIAQGRGLEGIATENKVLLSAEQAADLGVMPVSEPPAPPSNPSSPSGSQGSHRKAGTASSNSNSSSGSEAPRTWRPIERKKTNIDRVGNTTTNSEVGASAPFLESVLHGSSTTPVTSTLRLEREAVGFAPKRWMVGAAFLLLMAVAMGITALVFRNGDPLPEESSAQLGQLAISSEPNGAAIIIDGTRTGLFTPATVRGLPTDHPVKLILEKPHHRAYETEVWLDAKTRVERSVRLKPVHRVRFEIPAGSELVIDGATAQPSEGIDVPAGKIKVELKRNGRTIESRIIEVDGTQEVVRLGT